MNRKIKFSLLAVAVAVAAAGSVAYAANGGLEKDVTAIASAKISLVQAVTVAEQHVKGKAMQAEFEHAIQGWVYDVEVVNGTKVFDVKVDADKGTVISSAEDKADKDDDHDEQD